LKTSGAKALILNGVSIKAMTSPIKIVAYVDVSDSFVRSRGEVLSFQLAAFLLLFAPICIYAIAATKQCKSIPAFTKTCGCRTAVTDSEKFILVL